MTDRAHLYKPVVDTAGNVVPNINVALLQPGTETSITEQVYTGPTGTNTFGSTFDCPSGIIEIYLAAPKRIRVKVTVGSAPPVYFENVDVTIPTATASQIAFLPVGAITALNVQDALAELATSKTVVLSSLSSVHWRLVCDGVGALVTRSTNAAAPSVIWLTDSNNFTWQLGVTDVGALTTNIGVPQPADAVFTIAAPLILPSSDATLSYALTVTNTGALVTTEV